MIKTEDNISWRILFKQIKGETLSQEEHKAFTQWIKEPQHQAYFKKAVDTWYRRGTIPHTAIDKRIKEFDEYTSRYNADRHHPSLYRWIGYAAAILLPLFFLYGLIYYTDNNTHQSMTATVADSSAIIPGQKCARIILDDGQVLTLGGTTDSLLCDAPNLQIQQHNGSVVYNAAPQAEGAEKFNTIVIPRGGEYQLILSDGTKVWLNAASSLRYPEQFTRSRRTVELEGEAYFEVAHNAKSPFIVKTGKQEVRVYGTAFNIEAYPSDTRQRITLAQGSIGLIQSGHEYKLIPGQQANVSAAGTVEITKVDVSRFCNWHLGILSLDRERLEDILKKLELWYDVTFTYTDDSLKELHFSGDLERYANFGDILSLIKMTTHVDFQIEGRSVSVIRKP